MAKNSRISVATIDSPEFVNITSISPLVSKCEVKVLYVGENRNRSSISKEVAREMAQTLPGCPIVGYYLQNKEDFGDHGDQVIIDGEGVKFNKLTKPYGFVAPDSKIWFQKFQDTDEYGKSVIREYLMTEGYLWTGQFEEAKRVISEGNPQSMELDEKSLKGYWSTDKNTGIDFFIINDAMFSKLCILGEDVEPCFEGANVTSPQISSQFSKNDDFTKSLFAMIEELKYTLNNNKGGQSMQGNDMLDSNEPIVQFEDAGSDGGEATTEAPAEGETTTETEAPATEPSETETPEEGTTEPAEGEETEEQPTVTEEITDVVLNDTDKELINTLPEDYVPAVAEGETPETIAEALVKDGATNVPTQILQNSKAKEEDEKEEKSVDKEEKSDSEKTDNTSEGEKEADKEKKEEKDEDKKKKFSLEELEQQIYALKEENAKLLAFKQKVEEKEKDELINSFYMLSDEDKKDVVENKSQYSLEDIKAKLCIICVDKRVNFNLDNDENNSMNSAATTYNINAVETENLPAWLKAVEDTRNRK